MKNDEKICGKLIEFEERAASIYLTLARRFAENKDLSWFWLEMSMEEKQHALLLDFCGCEQAVVQGLPDRSTVQRLTRLFDDLEKRANRKNLSLDEAFLIAADLEGSEVNDIYSGVIAPLQGTPYVMRKKVETMIPNHGKTLLRGARKFGVSSTTFAKLAGIMRRENAKRM